MKSFFITFLLAFLLIVSANGDNPHRKRPPPPSQAPGRPAGPQPPSVLLSQFNANHLDEILSPIDQQIRLPRTRVSQLRAHFTDKQAQAPDVEKIQYQAAIAVCDALNAAMDEREKAIASLQGSKTVHSPSDLGARRKDIPTRGGIGTAILANTELRKEAQEERDRKQEAHENDLFFNTQLKTNWTQRAVQIRQNIQLLMARQRDAERTTQQPAGGSDAASATSTITLDKSVQVKVKYGTATIPAGTTLPVVERDTKGVVVQYMGENVLLPP